MLAGIQVLIGYPPNSKCSVFENNNYEAMDVDFSPEVLGLEGMTVSAGDGVKYKTVRLDKLEGKNFLNKMEMLMAVLADGS